MALGMAGCGKKAYKTFPEKYKLASVDVGGMTADEAKKAIKTAVGKYKISVKLDDASFDMTAKDLGLKYNDKADLQELINAANKDKKPEKQVKLFKMDKSDELETALVDSYITAKTQSQSDATAQSDTDAEANDDEQKKAEADTQTFDIRSIVPYRATIAYNAGAGQFEGVDGVSGDAPVYDNAATNLTSAVKELKDKVELDYQADTLLGQLADETVGSTEPNNRKDAIDALTALGYSSMDAAKAVKQADPNADMDAEDILKAALKYLM